LLSYISFFLWCCSLSYCVQFSFGLMSRWPLCGILLWNIRLLEESDRLWSIQMQERITQRPVFWFIIYVLPSCRIFCWQKSRLVSIAVS
jgi:hypothetical protein